MDTLTKRALDTPSELLKTAGELGPVISAAIDEEEKQGRLSASTIGSLRKAGFYKLFLPRSLGGLEVDPLTMCKLVEEIAHFNTAAGWSMMVANTSIFTACFLPDQGIDEIFHDRDVFIAGTVHPPMRAVKTDGGYIVNGKNPLLSNVREGNWILATALVMENDQPKIFEGHPVVIAVFMQASDCRIIETWQTIGMKATDSNDAEALNVFVPDHRSFPFVPDYPRGSHFQNSLYKIPAVVANIACLLAPVALAVASNAVSELKVLASKKTALGSMVPIRERGVVQRKIGRAEALVKSGRSYLHSSIQEAWEKVRSQKEISLDEKAGILLAATHANQCCAEAVDLVYTAAGTAGVYKRNKLSRYFSDSQVIRQHGFMNESRYETAGQIMMGLPPDVPLVAF